MGIRIVCVCLAACLWLGSGTAAAAGGDHPGRRDGRDQGRAPGSDRHRDGHRHWSYVHGGQRRARRESPARPAARPLQGHRRTHGLFDRGGGRRRTAGRPEPDRSVHMRVASLQETVTVTGESPLVDISSNQVGGNVDRRQMTELPLQGRNWMELAMQVRGVTANAVDNTPGSATGSSSSIWTARRSPSRWPAAASASQSSAARRSPSSRSSRTCSTSRRAARSVCRCRRSRGPGRTI